METMRFGWKQAVKTARENEPENPRAFATDQAFFFQDMLDNPPSYMPKGHVKKMHHVWCTAVLALTPTGKVTA